MDQYPAQSGHGQDGRSTDGAGGVADRAADAASTVKESGAQVAGTAKDRLGDVVSETRDQAGNLISEAQQRLNEEARKQTGRAGEVLRTWVDDLSAMAERSDSDSPAKSLVMQVSQQGKQLADRLEHGSPDELLNEVRSFARRRPVAFLFGTALAGFAVGRLAKGLSATSDSGSNQVTPSAPAQPTGARHAAAPEYGAPQYGAPQYAPQAGQGAYVPPQPGAPSPYDVNTPPIGVSGGPQYTTPTTGYGTPDPGYATPGTGYSMPPGGTEGRRQ